MPNPKSDSGRRRQRRPRFKLQADNVNVDVDVDVGGASRALSGLSIPDASSDSQSPKPTEEEFSIPDASSESQKPIPTQGSEMVDQTPKEQTLVQEGSKKKVIAPARTLREYRALATPELEAEWRAELKRNRAKDGAHGLKTSCGGSGTLPINSECIAWVPPDPKAWVPPGPEVKCDICGGNHRRSVCSYWVRVSPNTPIINERDYRIVCLCGSDFVNGLCSSGCLPYIPGRVVSRYHSIDATCS